MAKAMGRSVINIMFGALKGGSTLGGGEVSDRPVKSAGSRGRRHPAGLRPTRVSIVPGYGLAVAQAQHICSTNSMKKPLKTAAWRSVMLSTR